MNPQDLATVRSVLSATPWTRIAADNGAAVIKPDSPDELVLQTHGMLLASSYATEYRTALAAQGVQAGPNWMTIIGVVGGAVAIYFIWKHYQAEKVVDAYDYPEPQQDTRHRIRSMGKALGALRLGSGSSRFGRCGPRRMGAPPEKYEFEPESRLEGYRRRKARSK